MDLLRKVSSRREQAAALIIVLALVVLVTALAVAYFSRATSDRPAAHASFNQAKADQLAQSAMDNIIGDLRQEITNGSTLSNGIYTPTSNANMLPMRSAPNTIQNLVRISVRSDGIPPPAVPSRASAVNSTTDVSANGRSITLPRWNKHYLIPRPLVRSPSVTTPISDFAPPDWVFVTNACATAAPAPAAVIGRYAYAIYDEGGLLDANVAGYSSNATVTQFGRKGSQAFADLTALVGMTQSPGVDNIVGFRNYASAQPSGDFASNFTFSAASATLYYNYVIANNTGFLTVNPVPTPSASPYTSSTKTDQAFVTRQELINFCRATSGGMFTANALQYLGTFSRETNSPSFSPGTPTTTNPNLLLAQVTTPSFTRFDGTTANMGDPLIKTRFPLSGLAWITYKGPSANLATTDPVYTALTAAGVTAATIQAGTTANIQTCFGLTFGGTTGAPWTYSHGATNRILRLDEVAAAGREPDFFELLQAAILSGSLGQNTGGGVTGGNVFPDIHMSNTTHHILTIGACIIDQASPESIPTRIQFTGG